MKNSDFDLWYLILIDFVLYIKMIIDILLDNGKSITIRELCQENHCFLFRSPNNYIPQTISVTSITLFSSQI